MMTEHRIHKYLTEYAYAARCSCGWRSSRRTREQREEEAHIHQLKSTLVVRKAAAP